MTASRSPVESAHDCAGMLRARVASASAAHSWLSNPALARGPEGSRNAADFIHLLAMAHGRYPGLAETALVHTRQADARTLLGEIASDLNAERAVLARLVVEVGPMPSTAGQAACETALSAHAHAIDQLARSDREGCALGAAIALAGDWAAVRAVIDGIARRLSLDVPVSSLRSHAALAANIDALALSPPMSRAFLFGVDQLLVQHDGLWTLLEARARVRSEMD